MNAAKSGISSPPCRVQFRAEAHEIPDGEFDREDGIEVEIGCVAVALVLVNERARFRRSMKTGRDCVLREGRCEPYAMARAQQA
jgi:hypothetical protein